MGIFTSALRNIRQNTSNSQKKYLTSLPQRIACYLTAYFDEKSPFERLLFRSANRIRLRKCLQMCDYFRSQRKTWQGFIPVFNLVLSGHTYFNSANKTTVISLRPHENVSHNRTSRSAM